MKQLPQYSLKNGCRISHRGRNLEPRQHQNKKNNNKHPLGASRFHCGAFAGFWRTGVNNRLRLPPHSSAYSRFFEGKIGVFEAF